jgi:PAS domain S-box-containing protein
MHQRSGLPSAHTETIIITNRNFRITRWDETAERVFGWTPSEAAGKNIDDLLDGQYTPGGFGSLCAALFERGHAEASVCHRARDGRMLEALASLTLLKSSDGQITGIEHHYRWTEGQIAALNQAGTPPTGQAAAENPLSDILDGSMGEYWSLAIHGEGQWRFGGMVHPEDQLQADEAMQALMQKKEERFQLQCRFAKKSDSYVWSLLQGKIQYDRDGKPTSISGIAIDISEMKSMELQMLNQAKALRQQALEMTDKNKLMTDFFTNISHEFKTPLSIILVDLQLMEYRIGSCSVDVKEKLDKTISVMRQNALRLLRLIGNLLDVTKIDAGFMKARLVNLDIVNVASELTGSVAEYARSAGITVRFESSCESRIIPMDSEKLERIMLNLLSNAIKYTPSGGHIQVKLESVLNYILLSVKDDGAGISEDKKGIIFDRFRQANNTLTRSSEGCGIGLSLTKALVELLQGRIWFESTVGVGSEFFVELPVLELDWQAPPLDIDGMTLSRKVEMEFSDITRSES